MCPYSVSRVRFSVVQCPYLVWLNTCSVFSSLLSSVINYSTLPTCHLTLHSRNNFVLFRQMSDLLVSTTSYPVKWVVQGCVPLKQEPHEKKRRQKMLCDNSQCILWRKCNVKDLFNVSAESKSKLMDAKIAQQDEVYKSLYPDITLNHGWLKTHQCSIVTGTSRKTLSSSRKQKIMQGLVTRLLVKLCRVAVPHIRSRQKTTANSAKSNCVICWK